jgi:signal transduction histidine kinase
LDTSDMSVTAIDGLLTAMVAAAQLDAGVLNLKLVSTDLSTAVADVVRALHTRADEQQVQLSMQIPFGLPSVITDANLLNRVLLNIIGNAIKFTGAAHHGDGRVQITAQALDGYVSLIVADNGPGIAPDDLERLGQPFARGAEPPNAPAGFGLGLAFARGVIEQHPGGKLTINSVEGQGTMVVVRLTMTERGVDATSIDLEVK